MRHVPTLLRRDLAAYFFSPMCFLSLLAFQAIAWLNFWDLVEILSRTGASLSGARDPLNTYIAGSTPFWIALMVVVPAITMRLLAEERRSGTIETLLTTPIRESEVVVAKWLAGMAMYVTLLLPFALYLPFLYVQGRFPFDLGPVYSLGIGLVSMGMMFIAIGVFFSALTRNQIIAAIWTFAAMFLLILLTYLGYDYAASQRSPWAEAIQFSAVLYQTYIFGTGQLDLRFLALHVSVAGFMLYLSTKVLELRRES